jgi:hypothetical protein
VYGYKPNFCKYSKKRELVYPYLKETYLPTENSKEKELILLISQNNMKEMPFFEGLV